MVGASQEPLPAVVRALLIATAVVWLLAELRQSTVRRPNAATVDRGSRRVLMVSTVLGAALAALASRAAPDLVIASRVTAAWCGLALLWAGMGVRLWSIATLGQYFTFTVQTSGDQPVITRGPYRLIRHPSYAGSLLAVLGVGLCIGNWLSLLLLTLSVGIGIVYRIEVEDRALLADLGDDYREYAARHKRLVPYVW